MSSKLFVLAFAAGALAVPYVGHGHGHYHPHHSGSWSSGASAPASDAPFPYPSGNATGVWGTTGTGVSSSSAALSSSFVAVAPTTALSETDVYGSQAASSYDAASASETDCTTDITVTSTQKTTVYVTASESSSSPSYTSTVYLESTSYVYAGSSASSSPASSVSSSSSSSSVAASTPSSSSTEVAPVATSAFSSSSAAASSSAAPASYSSEAVKAYGWGSSSSAYSSSAAPTSYAASSTAAPSSYASSSSSSSAAASSSASSVSSGLKGKRGLAYNDVSLTDAFLSSSSVGWGYNWVPDNDGLSSDIQFLPTFHDSSYQNTFAASAETAIAAGAKTVFSLNEPDQTGQANLSPSAAASLHSTVMGPLAGKGADICAPSVSNGQGISPYMGLDYLLDFMSYCEPLNCPIDCLNLHWYSTSEYNATFLDHIANASTLFPNIPIWITEFGLTDGTSDGVSSFLETVMPELDNNPNVTGYAYYWVADGYLSDGSSPSSYGDTYMS